MKKMTLLKGLILLVLCVVGVGFYRGWFVLSSHQDTVVGSKVDVNLAVHPEKMKEDAKSVGESARELTDNVADKVTTGTPSSSPADDVKSKDN